MSKGHHYNPSQIISVQFNTEVERESKYVFIDEHQPVLGGWNFGQKVKAGIYYAHDERFCCLASELPDYYFVGDDKNVYIKRHVQVNFTDGSHKIKYFDTAPDVRYYVTRVKRSIKENIWLKF